MRALLSRPKNVAGILLTSLSLVIFAYSFVAAHEFRQISQWFPTGVAAVGFVLALAVMLWELGIVTWGASESLEGDVTENDSESSRSPLRGFFTYMAWLVVLAAALLTVGAVLAVFVWLLLFFRFLSKESWIRSLLYSVAAIVVIAVLTALLHLFLPAGFLIPSGEWIPRINIKF
jgi:hypothetical protein